MSKEESVITFTELVAWNVFLALKRKCKPPPRDFYLEETREYLYRGTCQGVHFAYIYPAKENLYKPGVLLISNSLEALLSSQPISVRRLSNFWSDEIEDKVVMSGRSSSNEENLELIHPTGSSFFIIGRKGDGMRWQLQ